MKKINISKFEDFVDSSFLKEEIQTDDSTWGKYFNDQIDKAQQATSGGGDSKGLPSWATTVLQLDALKGKSADDRWDWLTKRVDSNIKNKQASKVESIKTPGSVELPGYRILWKEDKTETDNYVDPKTKKEYKTYFTEIYKGNPGSWRDRRDDSGTPGPILRSGYWGQNSTVQKAAGATGSTGVQGGILWAVEPESSKSSTGGTGADVSLLDLLAATTMGRQLLNFVLSDEDYEKLSQGGKIKFTDNPPTTKELKALTPEQKKAQEENAKKMAQAGQKVEEPKYSEITSSGDYTYNPSSFDVTWNKLYKALKKAGVGREMNFRKTNLVGIRNTPFTKSKFSNRFTDLIAVMGPEKTKEIKIYPATTTPGPAFIYKPFRNWWISIGLKETLDPQGPGILQPGVYEYSLGDYKGKYEAFIQDGKVKISRIPPVDELAKVRFTTFSPGKIEEVSNGFDIIKAETNTPSIDSFSAGAQVFKKSSDFKEALDKVKSSKQSTFQYALINSSDLGED